jgi:hypothetical protein
MENFVHGAALWCYYSPSKCQASPTW